MKKLFILSMLAALTSCSSLKVTYDYDKQADFKKYKTYAFTDASQKLQVDELNRNRILKAIESELTVKGFTKSDNPDVLVDLDVKTERQTEATATTSGTGYYGGPWRYGYGSGFTTTQVNYNTYIEGTLFVNIVDKSTDKIAWQGRATKTIDPDLSAEKREANINDAVHRVFLNYPPKQ